MKNYEIEHIGISVREPIKMANWYKEILGFNIRFSALDEEKGVVFLTDSTDNVMLEFGKIPDVSSLADRINHHLQLHIALNPDLAVEIVMRRRRSFTGKERRRFKEYWNISMSKSF